MPSPSVRDASSSAAIATRPRGMLHTVQSRLTTGFALLVLMLLGVSVYSIFTARHIDQRLSENSSFNSVVQRAAINFRGSAHDRSIAIRDVVLAPSADAMEREAQTIAHLAKFYADSSLTLQAALKSRPQVPLEVGPLVQDIEAMEARAVHTTQRILQLMRDHKQSEAGTLLWSDAKPQYEQWLAAINRLIDFLEARIRDNTQEANTASAKLPQVMLTLCAIAVVVSGITSVLLSRSILSELGAEPQQVRDVIRAMQKGNLTVDIPQRPNDTRSVMVALRDMRSQLHGLVSAVCDNVQQLHGISDDIHRGNQRLEQRSTEAVHNLAGIAHNIDALAQAVHHSAESARQANALATQAASTAVRGGEVMHEVVDSMQSIQSGSQKISDITSVIDSIAFQTNILALNAAVEAARAGEQGRGFAVVATEVRQLAQRSAHAAREIKQLIGASVQQVDTGSRLVRHAGKTMQEIVDSVQRVHSMLGEISNAAGSQRSGIEQVHQAVGMLDQMTQQNTALVSDSSQAASALQSQAQRLSAIVAQFFLDDQVLPAQHIPDSPPSNRLR